MRESQQQIDADERRAGCQTGMPPNDDACQVCHTTNDLRLVNNEVFCCKHVPTHED